MERQRMQHRPIKKTSVIPFSKYQINHQQKQNKRQTTQRVIKQLKDKQKQSLAQIHQEGQTRQLLNKNEQNKQQQQSIAQKSFESSQNDRQSQFSEQQQNNKYFLTKKHREITYQLNSDGDPPLLYDIGLQPQMIKDKLRLVLKLGEPDYDMIMNPDLAGPVMIAFGFGFLLLFTGQLQFGDIYALFILGNALLWVLFNFMAKSGVISLYNVMSILGYCLLPMWILGFAGIFMKLSTGKGLIISLAISIWSSSAAGNFIQALIRGKKNRKLLIIYPLFLFYVSFAMIVIF